jgi:PAS domain S-box-containing protein
MGQERLMNSLRDHEKTREQLLDDYRSLLESAPDAMVIVDQRGTIVLINSQAEKMFGYRREELVGAPVEVLLPERYRADHVAKREKFTANADVRPMGEGKRFLGRRKDGREFPVEISLSPLRTEAGLLVMSAIRDLSQRERLLGELRKAEVRYRTLVEEIPAVTFMASLEEAGDHLRELYVSPQIEALLGFSQKEWLEDPVLWHRQLHPEDRDRWNVEFAPTIARGEPFSSVYRFVARDGRVVWVRGEAKVIKDDAGRPLYLQGIAFDITAIKEAEEALRRANEDLERRVQERTEALARSMAELQEKTAELEKFAYVASHDLQKPLRSLASFPGLLAKNYGGKFGGKADEWINRTINGAKRMQQLIVRLEAYSRVVPRDRVFQPTDCSACAREACSNLQADLAESGGQVLVGELPMVQGNYHQLMLLFQNLIGNALKFRDPGRSVRVEVGSRRDQDHWRLWVRDNGIGIEKEHFTKIFELGTDSRLHPESKYPGYGYGLHICEKIVTGHGGRIWAESELGQGSIFFFTLPAAGPG